MGLLLLVHTQCCRLHHGKDNISSNLNLPQNGALLCMYSCIRVLPFIVLGYTKMYFAAPSDIYLNSNCT